MRADPTQCGQSHPTHDKVEHHVQDLGKATQKERSEDAHHSEQGLKDEEGPPILSRQGEEADRDVGPGDEEKYARVVQFAQKGLPSSHTLESVVKAAGREEGDQRKAVDRERHRGEGAPRHEEQRDGADQGQPRPDQVRYGTERMSQPAHPSSRPNWSDRGVGSQ